MKNQNHEINDKAYIKGELRDNIRRQYRKDLDEASNQEVYQAISLIVKDFVIDEWLKTQKVMDEKDPKIVYYMSMEFLIGRLLGNNMINLKAYDVFKDVLEDLGFDLANIEDDNRIVLYIWKRSVCNMALYSHVYKALRKILSLFFSFK